MKIEDAFEAALLKYIQRNVNQLAEGLVDYEQNQPNCWGHTEDDSCCCDTSIRVNVRYRVPREVNRFGYLEWSFYGNFFDLITTLDEMEGADG